MPTRQQIEQAHEAVASGTASVLQKVLAKENPLTGGGSSSTSRKPKQTQPKQTQPKQREPKQREPKQREPKQREPKQTPASSIESQKLYFASEVIEAAADGDVTWLTSLKREIGETKFSVIINETRTWGFIGNGNNPGEGGVIEGVTALHMAVYEGHRAVVDFLVKSGSNVHRKDLTTGKSPLDLARKYSELNSLVEILQPQRAIRSAASSSRSKPSTTTPSWAKTRDSHQSPKRDTKRFSQLSASTKAALTSAHVTGNTYKTPATSKGDGRVTGESLVARMKRQGGFGS